MNVDHTAPLMEVRGLRTQFGENVVHESLDFQIHSKEILGLVGGSGSGKTVLMNTFLGLKQPDGGAVYYFGHDRATMPEAERHLIDNQIGVLFMRELADMKIHMVGLPAHAATLYPADLSGGMRKRAGLARSLALDPKLLFLDEPTAGLDPIGASAFDQLILDLREAMDLTVLMITPFYHL